MEVSIHRLDDIPVHALRIVGEYHIQAPRAWQRLWGWYGTLAVKPALTGAYGYDLDNPRHTPADQCRYDACLAIVAMRNARAGSNASRSRAVVSP